MVEKPENIAPVKDAALPPTSDKPTSYISASDNQRLVNSKAKDDPNLTPMELHDHVSPAVAEAFRKDPVQAMLDIYSAGLKQPNESADDKATRLTREELCKQRFKKLQTDDPKLFSDITRIGEQIASNQLTPAQAGKEVGAAARALLDRAKLANGGQSPEFDDKISTGFVALSSTMLAERGTFPDHHDPQKTKAMIDAVEAELRKGGAVDMTMPGPANKLYPAQIHGVTWAKTGEPALCGWTTDGKKDRYKFEINL